MRELYNEFDFLPFCRPSCRPKIVSAAIGAGIAAVAGIAMSAYNAHQTEKANRKNRDWTESENQKTREAEAHALQTRTDDAVQAGFSPLAALDTGAAQVSNPLNYTAQAPQMDLSSMIGAVSDAGMTISNQYAQQKLQKAQLADNAANRDNQYKIAKLQCQSQKDIAADNISSAEKIADDENSLKWIKMNQDYSVAQNNLQLLLSKSQSDTSKVNTDIKHQQQQQIVNSLDAWAKGLGIRIRYTYIDTSTDKGKALYDARMKAFQSRVGNSFTNMSSWYKNASPEERAEFWSKAQGENKSGSLDVGAKLPGLLKGVGGNIGVAGSVGENESVSSKMRSDVMAIQAQQWFGKGELVFPLEQLRSSAPDYKPSFYSTPKHW